MAPLDNQNNVSAWINNFDLTTTMGEPLKGGNICLPSSILAGTRATLWIGDEISFPTKKIEPEVAYISDTFPAAKVEIYLEKRGHRHPRHPDPTLHQSINLYYVVVGGRRSTREFTSLAIAKVFAQPLHNRLVDALTKESHANNPKFGRF